MCGALPCADFQAHLLRGEKGENRRMTNENIESASVCPRCGARFMCRHGDVTHCQCAAVALGAEDRAYIAARYQACLCADCLRALADERQRQA